MLAALALATSVSPFSTDMYLTALPRMAGQFAVSTSMIELTLTAFLLGLGFGQLVIGPLSDSIGRRRPLLVGVACCIGASVVCAVAPTIEVLIAARFVAGFAGAAGVVLSRAIISDRTSGAATARVFSLLAIVGGTAPILAPILGTTFVAGIGWRGIFWVLTAITVMVLVVATVLLPESLPVQRRSKTSVAALRTNARYVLNNRAFVGYTAVFALNFMTLFAWISASPFVLQGKLGLSTGWYAVAFAINPLGLIAANTVNARIVRRVGTRRMIGFGLAGLATSTLLQGVNVATGTHLWPTVVLALLSMACNGFIIGNVTALALGQVRKAAGTASALLGAAQFALGSLAAPIVGLAGNASAVPVAASMIVTTTLAIGAFRWVGAPTVDEIAAAALAA